MQARPEVGGRRQVGHRQGIDSWQSGV